MSTQMLKKNRLRHNILFVVTFIALTGLIYPNVYADGCSGVNFKASRDFPVAQRSVAVVAGQVKRAVVAYP